MEMEAVGSDGGRNSEYMDSEGPEISEDNLFFFDASAMTAWPTQMTQYTAAVTTLGVLPQDNLLADDEPPYDPDAEYVESGAKQCFNCMATTHIVSDCPYKRDPQHIALARADYGSRGGNTTRSMRLHEAEDIFKRRMEFAGTFEPGYIQGETLREGLGLSKAYGGGNEDLPWYYTMCDWGYPPGWVSDIDPRSKIVERINSTSKYELSEVFTSLAIFDDEHSGPLAISPNPSPHEPDDDLSIIPSATHESPSNVLPDSQAPPPPPEDLPFDELPPPPPDLPPLPPDEPPPVSPLPPDSLPFPPRRWVHYRTTLFQSERLPISLVTRPLPALAEAPPPPPSGPPPPPPSAPPPPSPPQPPKQLTEQDKRRLLWEQIVAANS
ncbi:unnamed protein product [Rhizoctonia solani]|uniref:Zinc finger CCHC domain-containing protein 8 n=1 Tax=Rhizoctonia solani TaxID=456999 RepID=A0A8H3AE76_9AGAM|nr:unnamed protein product [Rhizoctonia solani]